MPKQPQTQYERCFVFDFVTNIPNGCKMLAIKVLSLIPHHAYMWITRKTIWFYRNSFSSDVGHLGVSVCLSVRLTYYIGRTIHKHPLLWKYSVICLKTTQWSIRWRKKPHTKCYIVHIHVTRYTLHISFTSEWATVYKIRDQIEKRSRNCCHWQHSNA